MRIDRAKVSDAIGFFRPRFMQKYNLKEYNSQKHAQEPAIFFGCYALTNFNQGLNDVFNIHGHAGLAVIFWGGSDAFDFKNILLGPKNPRIPEWITGACRGMIDGDRFKHIAQSQYIVDDLAALGRKSTLLPISTAIHDDFTPTPLGKKVYIYINPGNPNFYGAHLVPEIRKRLPEFEFLEVRFGDHKFDQMSQVYDECFIGMRLTPHDALPHTVIEMGLKGRRCLWNGGAPNAIPFMSSCDIVNAVISESQKIGTMQEGVAESVKDYINVPDDWLHTEFYEDK